MQVAKPPSDMNILSRRLVPSCFLAFVFVACSAGSDPAGGSSEEELRAVCQGPFGHTKAPDGSYYISAFGCWVDAAGGKHGDSGDNCIPSCLSKAKAAGLCTGTGKQCEESVTWYVADAARFGCLGRVRVTNPKNGKSVIAVALDNGPGCRVENSVSKPVLDASGRINRYLFGADQGSSDRTRVQVEEVSANTPLGPEVGGPGGGEDSGAGSDSSAGTGADASNGRDATPSGTHDACATDGDCNPGSDGTGRICSGGACVPGCKSSAQCPGVTRCVNGQCR